MSDAEERSLHKRLDKQDRTLERLEFAIRGDKTVGHLGIVDVQKDHSKRITKLERMTLYAIGVGGGLSIAWQIVSTFIAK